MDYLDIINYVGESYRLAKITNSDDMHSLTLKLNSLAHQNNSPIIFTKNFGRDNSRFGNIILSIFSAKTKKQIGDVQVIINTRTNEMFITAKGSMTPLKFSSTIDILNEVVDFIDRWRVLIK